MLLMRWMPYKLILLLANPEAGKSSERMGVLTCRKYTLFGHPEVVKAAWLLMSVTGKLLMSLSEPVSVV